VKETINHFRRYYNAIYINHLSGNVIVVYMCYRQNPLRHDHHKLIQPTDEDKNQGHIFIRRKNMGEFFSGIVSAMAIYGAVCTAIVFIIKSLKKN